jgi:hypothetical protein
MNDRTLHQEWFSCHSSSYIIMLTVTVIVSWSQVRVNDLFYFAGVAGSDGGFGMTQLASSHLPTSVKS